MMMKFYLILTLQMLVGQLVLGQTVIKLYEGKAPGSENWNWQEKETTPFPQNRMLYNVSEPELLYYPSPKEKANGRLILKTG